MAQIKCNDCGKEISSKTKNCIHCGAPLKNNKINFDELKVIIKKFWYLIVIGIVIIFIILINFFSHSNLVGTYEFKYEWHGETHKQLLILENNKDCFIYHDNKLEGTCSWRKEGNLIYLKSKDPSVEVREVPLTIRGKTLISVDNDVLVKIN